MGNRGKQTFTYMDHDIWAPFDYGDARYDEDGILRRGHEKQSPENIATCLLGMTGLVQMHLQGHGAAGTKRKRALKRFRELVAAKSVRMAALEACRIGVKREHLNAMALLVKG